MGATFEGENAGRRTGLPPSLAWPGRERSAVM